MILRHLKSLYAHFTHFFPVFFGVIIVIFTLFNIFFLTFNLHLLNAYSQSYHYPSSYKNSRSTQESSKELLEKREQTSYQPKVQFLWWQAVTTLPIPFILELGEQNIMFRLTLIFCSTQLLLSSKYIYLIFFFYFFAPIIAEA